MPKIIQSTQILKKIYVKNLDDGKAVLDFLINFFVYLPIGDTISTPYADFIKVDEDFIKLELKITKEEITDTLEKTRIIKIV